MHALAIMLIFDQELGRSTDINLKDIFVFHPIFRSRHEITIKSINRTKGVLLSAHLPHGITSSIIIQNSQLIKKKLSSKNQKIG